MLIGSKSYGSNPTLQAGLIATFLNNPAPFNGMAAEPEATEPLRSGFSGTSPVLGQRGVMGKAWALEKGGAVGDMEILPDPLITLISWP